MVDNNGYFLLAYILIAVGAVGIVLPLVPAAPLIWSGVLMWAWADGFQKIGWPTLLLLGLLALVAWGSDILLTLVMKRKVGVSWKAIGGAIVGGLLGGLFLSVLPFVGTFVGALLGAVLGVLLVEYLDKRNWGRAWRASISYLVGTLVSSAVELLFCVAMIGIFLWQAFS